MERQITAIPEPIEADALHRMIVQVVSSGKTGYEHIRSRISSISKNVHVRWVPEPAEMIRQYNSTHHSSIGRDWVCIVLDLTTGLLITAKQTVPLRGGNLLQPSADGQAADIWWVDAIIAVSRMPHHIPLLVVTDHEGIETILLRYGFPLMGVMLPSSPLSHWHQVLTRIVKGERRPAEQGSDHDPTVFRGMANRLHVLSDTAIQIDSHLWVDLERCNLRSQEKIIPLVGQEVLVLEVLLGTPGRFYSAERIADRIAEVRHSLTDAHCVEQTISKLRRKFGEQRRQPRILVSRRGVGYALYVSNQSGKRQTFA